MPNTNFLQPLSITSNNEVASTSASNNREEREKTFFTILVDFFAEHEQNYSCNDSRLNRLQKFGKLFTDLSLIVQEEQSKEPTANDTHYHHVGHYYCGARAYTAKTALENFTSKEERYQNQSDKVRRENLVELGGTRGYGYERVLESCLVKELIPKLSIISIAERVDETNPTTKLAAELAAEWARRSDQDRAAETNPNSNARYDEKSLLYAIGLIFQIYVNSELNNIDIKKAKSLTFVKPCFAPLVTHEELLLDEHDDFFPHNKVQAFVSSREGDNESQPLVCHTLYYRVPTMIQSFNGFNEASSASAHDSKTLVVNTVSNKYDVEHLHEENQLTPLGDIINQGDNSNAD